MQSHAGLWDQLGSVLAQRGVHVLAPDRRGHGKSAWRATYHVLDYVADLAVLMAGERFRYTTGDFITVDGGLAEAFPR